MSIKERLQKVIAKTGLASRREAEVWIAAGRVAVNGETVTEAGVKVDAETDEIRVDGKPLPAAAKHYYYLFNKPKNVVVARQDPQGRPIIYDYLKELPTLLHPVGRLDFDSEGLLLLTNDGTLHQHLTHPSTETPKIYHVKVKGDVARGTQQKLRDGVNLDDGIAQARQLKLLKTNPHNCWLEIVVTEGRNRLVRRLCDAVGHPVLRLIRVGLAGIELGSLEAGAFRPLQRAEVDQLLKLV